jgi:hypothetical protein
LAPKQREANGLRKGCLATDGSASGDRLRWCDVGRLLKPRRN